MALRDIPHDLIRSCRNGDREAIECLIREITPDLYRILFSALRDHDDTDEVVQETLVRVFRYIGSLKDEKRFPAWIMRIAMNQANTFRVKRSRTRTYDMENSDEVSNSAIVLGGTPALDPRRHLMAEQIREEIARAMESLPQRQRMATTLFEVEGFTIKEIAASLECSEGAVKFNIHEGRKKLKRKLIHLVRDLRWGREAARQLGVSEDSQSGGQVDGEGLVRNMDDGTERSRGVEDSSSGD